MTIWDVARRAGVSKSTVSLVLNDSPLVKAETRRRVQETIKAMNYVPNYKARGLVKKNNECIGIIHALTRSRDLKRHYEWNYGLEQFSSDIEDGIFEAVMGSSTNLSIVKEHVPLYISREERPKTLQNHRVDGAILLGGFGDADIRELIRGVDIPLVLIGSGFQIKGQDMVLHDPARGTFLAAKALMETGHRRICLLNSSKKNQVWPKRIEGIRAAAESCGYPLDEGLLVSPDRNTGEGAYHCFCELLDRGVIPDGVLAANNEIALGVLRCLYERRLRVPDDISVITYEDSSICGNLSPALTAVNIQKELIGQTALKLLLERIEDPSLPPRMVVVEPYLVSRASVKDRRS